MSHVVASDEPDEEMTAIRETRRQANLRRLAEARTFLPQNQEREAG